MEARYLFCSMKKDITLASIGRLAYKAQRSGSHPKTPFVECLAQLFHGIGYRGLVGENSSNIAHQRVVNFFITLFCFFRSVVFNVISATIFKKEIIDTFIFWRCNRDYLKCGGSGGKVIIINQHNFTNFGANYRIARWLLVRNENCPAEAINRRSRHITT